MNKVFSLCLICLLIIKDSFAQKNWDINKPDLTLKSHSFSVKEGTWLNIDISPDGKMLVFDLLGDIYTLPIEGGMAKAIRKGHSLDVQPRFSPDGKKILFTSDASGGDNIWVMDVNGNNAKSITKENFRLLNNAVWSPDGNYIIAKKHFSSTRSLGAGELWIYHISGGEGIQLTKRKNDQQDVNEPSCSKDGRYIYYSEDMYPGGYFQYNKDPNNQIFVINRYDRKNGKMENITGGPGGACRPQISNDGKILAFIKRVRTKTVLYLRNIETGEEWPIYDKLSKDQQEAWTTFGVYPGFTWTPDDKDIIIWSQGKIIRINADKFNVATEIPFECNVEIKIADALRFEQNLNPIDFKVNVIRHAVTSPDGKWLVFNAVGHLWKKELPYGEPSRLTSNSDFEFDPSFSSDGKTILFTTWNDENMGSIHKIDFLNTLNSQKISRQKGIFRTPHFSPDNKKIIFTKENGNTLLGVTHTVNAGIYIMNEDGSDLNFITNDGFNAEFNAKGDRIFYESGYGMNSQYKSCNLNGQDVQTIFKSVYGNQYKISPDEKWVTFVDLFKVYIAPFPNIGKVIELSANTNAIPVRQVAKDAGINLHWSKDNQFLHFTLGENYYTVDLKDRFDFDAAKNDSIFFNNQSFIKIGLTLNTDKPIGTYALTHAKIITMEKDSVIDDGTIIIENNIIKTIGKSNQIETANIKTIVCNGKRSCPVL